VGAREEGRGGEREKREKGQSEKRERKVFAARRKTGRGERASEKARDREHTSESEESTRASERERERGADCGWFRVYGLGHDGVAVRQKTETTGGKSKAVVKM
jgi:hypothetical protein